MQLYLVFSLSKCHNDTNKSPIRLIYIKYCSQFLNNQEPYCDHSLPARVLFQFLVFSAKKFYWLLYCRGRVDCGWLDCCTLRMNIADLTLCRYKLYLTPLCKDSLIFAKLLGIGQMLVESSRDDRSCWKLSNTSCHGIERLWSDLVNSQYQCSPTL